MKEIILEGSTSQYSLDIVVMIIVQGKIGVLSSSIPFGCLFIMVKIKLTAPKIEGIPSKCGLNTTKST